MDGRWQRDAGLRIDHLPVIPGLRVTADGGDRDVRCQPGASDHAPGWVEMRGEVCYLGWMRRITPLLAWFATTRSRRIAGFGLLSLLVMVPALVQGVGRADSFIFNIVWGRQFAQASLTEFYPRWMPDSFGGRGSPVFLFYPPLAFMFDAAVNVVTAGLIPIRWRLAVTAWLLLWLSGVAMEVWLGRRVAPSVALAAGAALILAPYHLLDQYWRGALAEFAAIAMLPLLLAGVEAAARGWRGVPWLGLGLAGIVATHLPFAVLVSVTVVPAVLCASVPSWRVRPLAAIATRAGLGGVLGVALAAIYLMPALLLQGNISISLMWSEYFQPTPWLLTSFTVWPSLQLMSVVAALAMANLIGCVAVLLTLRGRPGTRLARALAIASMLGVFMLAGLIPFVWEIPLLAKVQFPWRLLGMVEVASIGALALAAGSVPGRALRPVLVAMAFVSLPGAAIVAYQGGVDVIQAREFARNDLSDELAQTPDAAEYLPAGIPRDIAVEFSRRHFPPMPPARTVTCVPVATRCERDTDGFIVVDGPAPVTVTVQTFYFPGWQARLDDGTTLPARPAAPNRVLAIDVPAGHTRFQTERAPTWPERAGADVSLVAGLITAIWLAVGRRRKERQ